MSLGSIQTDEERTLRSGFTPGETSSDWFKKSRFNPTQYISPFTGRFVDFCIDSLKDNRAHVKKTKNKKQNILIRLYQVKTSGTGANWFNTDQFKRVLVFLSVCTAM